MNEKMVERPTVREIVVDGFTQHTCRDGLMSCVGYRWLNGECVIVIRLAWPEVNTISAISDAVEAMGSTPLPVPKPVRRKVH